MLKTCHLTAKDLSVTVMHLNVSGMMTIQNIHPLSMYLILSMQDLSLTNVSGNVSEPDTCRT